MTYAIETSGLTHRFGRTDAVSDLTLQVPAGSIFALIGPNGAGKTTTIKLLMNLLRPQRGTARVLGVDSQQFDWRQLRRIGYVSENQQLPDWMTVRQLLDWSRPFYPAWDDALVRRLSQSLGLSGAVKIRSLSRGTRMKVALLVSLAYRPELIVLDEPFTGLDPLVRDELIRALLEAASDGLRTIFMASHDIDDIERLADWIGFIADGRLMFAEPVGSLLARFRLIEVFGATPLDGSPTMDPRWFMQPTAGPTRQFIDTAHDAPDAAARIAAAFPSAEIRVAAMPLRDIFIALAARAAGRSAA